MPAELRVLLAHEKSNPGTLPSHPVNCHLCHGPHGEGEQQGRVSASPFLTGAISNLKLIDQVLEVLELTNFPTVR